MKYLTVLLIVLSACSSSKKGAVKNTEAEILPTDKITLSRSGCYGTCPMYSLEIFGDGHFLYDGNAYVDNLGKFKGQLSSEETQALFSHLQSYDWLSYPDMYPTDNVDFPAFFLTYENGKITKKIKGNSRAASELIALSKQLDQLFATQDLEKLD